MIEIKNIAKFWNGWYVITTHLKHNRKLSGPFITQADAQIEKAKMVLSIYKAVTN